MAYRFYRSVFLCLLLLEDQTLVVGLSLSHLHLCYEVAWHRVQWYELPLLTLLEELLLLVGVFKAGFCRFDNVRVPLDGLLDRYASVTADGTYSSPIPTVGARFGTMVIPHLPPPPSMCLDCWPPWR
jgi:hypothetical protein